MADVNQTIIPNSSNEAVQAPVNGQNMERGMPPPSGNKRWVIVSAVVLVIFLISLVVYKMKNTSENMESKANKTSGNQALVQNVDRNGKISLSPSIGNYKLGASFNVDIIVSAPNTSLDGVDVVLSYDPSLFEVTTARGNAFPDYPRMRVDSANNRIYMTGYTLEPVPTPIVSNFIFAKLTLTGKRAGQGEIKIVWNNGAKNLSTIIENKTSNTLLGSVVNGKYTITK